MKTYHDIAGDGGSDIAGQVASLRGRIAERLAGVRHIVAIGSGKGGVGKSTLAMQIALALRGAGSRVTILDADLNGPSQARLAGLEGVPLVPSRRGLAVPASAADIGVVSIGGMLPDSRSLEFDTVATGGSHVWRSAREITALSELLAAVEWGAIDFLLVDLPPGAERTFQYAEALGDRAAFVLVTIPSRISQGVVSRSVDALRRAPNRILGYIENMKGYHCAGCGEIRPLFPAPDGLDLGIPCLGSVPFDPDLAASCDAGRPLPDDAAGPTADPIRSIAARISRLMEAAP